MRCFCDSKMKMDQGFFQVSSFQPTRKSPRRMAFRRQHEGKIAPRRKKSTIEMDLPRRSVVRSKTLRMAACRFLSACHARWRNHVSLPLRWRCLRRLWSRIWSLSTSRLLRCLLLSSACRRNRRLVRGSARACLARQAWMPCRGSGRPRLAPASASS